MFDRLNPTVGCSASGRRRTTENYDSSVDTPTSSDLIKFHLYSTLVPENSAVGEM